MSGAVGLCRLCIVNGGRARGLVRDVNPHTQDSGRYVIQRHARGNHVHWDFMLESGDSLRTWRIDVPPEQLLHAAAKASRIADHPLRFLTYEGPVNQGAGTVAIADSGTYTVQAQSDDELEIRLQGRVLNGVFRMDDLGDGNYRLTPVNTAP